MLLMSGGGIRMNGVFSFLAPSTPSLFLFGASGGVPVFQYDRWWTVLSAGWLAQRHPAHPVQHDVGAAARARLRRTLWRRPAWSSSTRWPG